MKQTITPAFTITEISEALTKAKAAALAANKPGTENDFGTCNFDSPTLQLPGLDQSDINEIESLSGIKLSRIEYSKMWKGSYRVGVPLYGQGDNRTRMAEAANRSLVQSGMPASMYYQMD